MIMIKTISFGLKVIMKSLTENAELSFRKDMSALMALMGITKHELAEMLGCTRQTVTKMYSDPFSVSGRYILMVQEYLKREERKRYQ